MCMIIINKWCVYVFITSKSSSPLDSRGKNNPAVTDLNGRIFISYKQFLFYSSQYRYRSDMGKRVFIQVSIPMSNKKLIK